MIERIVSIFAVAQAILTTLQAGTNLLERCLWENVTNDCVMDGPRILPPNSTSSNATASPLYDLTECVRDGIRLGLQPHYDEIGIETSCVYTTEAVVVPNTTSHDADPSAQVYSLSLQPALLVDSSNTEDEEEDEATSEDETSSDVHDVIESESSRRSRVMSTLRRVSLPWFPPRDPPKLVDDDMEEEPILDFGQAYVMQRSIPNTTTTATIRTYAPRTFHSLRRSFGISANDFERTLLSAGPYVSFQTNSKGSAAKGVFFFTPNGAFLIKSIKPAEKTSLLSILPQYTEYMRQQQGKSLLSQICGMYEVAIPPSANGGAGQDYCLIIMNSVFPAGVAMNERYDLKGSTVGRKAGAGENVMKDLDLVESESSLNLTAATKQDLLAQLRKDVELLEACSLIDYSLLVGISIATNSTDQPLRRPLSRRFLRALLFALRMICRPPRTSAPPTQKESLSTVSGRRAHQPATYFLGVIDFLQPFNTRKAVEYQLKCLLHKKDTFSCVPPSTYADRFMAFMDQRIS